MAVLVPSAEINPCLEQTEFVCHLRLLAVNVMPALV